MITKKIFHIICFVVIYFLTQPLTFANPVYTPPFYDAVVPPHDSIIVKYDFNPKNQFLSCFSNRSGLIAAWKFGSELKISEIPIELTSNIGDSKGEMQIYNNSDEPYKMVNCQYQSK